jgi:hypothetical protein
MLLMAVLIVVVVMEGGPRMHLHALNSAAPAMPEGDFRTAKITKESDGRGCWRQIFDNQTGSMVRSQEPCDATSYDANGAPVPVGTIHRLDAISKSFSGH